MHTFSHGLMVAGTRSGCGKTTLTLCLLAALRRRGLTVQACKTGPDFIDPGHHAVLTGRPSYNLDTWMGGPTGVERILHRMRQHGGYMLLAEGVMGLFDSAHGMGGPGSSAHLAQLLGLPILLMVDARGMGQSAAAVAAGFERMLGLPLAGVVCTHVGGLGHQSMLREAFAHIQAQDNAPLLGLLPREGLPDMPSRHLGLLMAHECAWDTRQTEAMAQWCEAHIDVDALLRHCVLPSSNALRPGANVQPETSPKAIARIAIAYDEAFCFLYPDMPDVLREEGADIHFFSPLNDRALPRACTALYFPGGYPELHAQRLCANTSMRHAIRAFVETGGLVYGECGGYMYLMESLEIDGHTWPMCGCLPLGCHLQKEKAALGYREVRPVAGSPFAGVAGLRARGHEFHYARLLEGPTCPPLWEVADRLGRPLPPEGALYGRVAASWVHLYPEGARQLLRNLLHGCAHDLS